MSPRTRVNTEELEEWKDKTDRSSIRHFFVRISAQELANKQRTDFRKYGRKLRKERRKRGGAARAQKQKQHKLDRTIGLTTVNVRGLATKLHELGGKLQGLKEQHARGQRDVSFIQETHLYPEELAAAKEKHVALWGFKRSQADKFSFWSSGTERSRSAGVAILVNPYGAVKEAKPWQEHQWSEHVMMITGKITGKLFLFVNVYAPSPPAERIKFYHHLQQLCPPEGAEVVIGGDFNCVLRRDVDRTGSNYRDDEGAMELETIINKLGLVDAGFYNMPQGRRQSDITKYANEHHTHRHKAADGSIGTSRLDRWYIGATAKRLLRGVVTEESPCNADHRAVLLELHAPSGCTRMKKRAKIYPAPNYVQAATHSMITLKLKELQKETLKWRRGEAATKWDAFKQTIKEAMTHLKKAARARMNNGFRQKIQRVKQKLGKCDYGSQAENEKRRYLLDTLHKLQEERRVLRRRNLIEQNAWSSKKTTRHFFKRICTKFGDNVIPKLTQSATGPQRGVHEKANILADSWEPIFNGASAVDESIEEYVGRLHSRWKTMDLSDIDEAITEDEVAAAINKSKRGEACGPDDLGNEWYQDHCDNVVPILTKLYNESMEGEQVPKTFVEAFIFSITKGGDTSNPLNYRPIALLNTDYKILARILAWRVRKHITKIVHSTQCGFVPGRTIHEAIDLLEAIKVRCREGKTLSKAQVLLLDFAKAYDSLDRAFLLEVLRSKGFPPKFCRLVEAIHTNTSVRFMANGELSRSVQVTRGIRQGCPLAPLLFIIAVDLLYDEIEMTHDIVGIKMDDRGEVSEIRAAGYADDTAIYIQHIRMQRAAIQAVARFSAVSGLNLNVKKSVAINLGCSSTTAEKEDASSVQTDKEVMARDSTRYLGHVAGAGNTTEEAWSKALGALRVRLALAETKTNTSAQRAAIAAAIVIPKLLFVARHAWPTDTIVKKADKCIKNFVWRSYFAEPEGAVSGWVKGVIVEQPPKEGGLGVPSLELELIAMSAMTVGAWALTTKPRLQVVGDILQTGGSKTAEMIIPYSGKPRMCLGANIWDTGRPWVEKVFAPEREISETEQSEIVEMRRALRPRMGLSSKWGRTGLTVKCAGAVRTLLGTRVRQRRERRGDLLHEAIGEVLVRSLLLWSEEGKQRKWKDYRRLVGERGGERVQAVTCISNAEDGGVTFSPVGWTLPMAGGMAILFKDFCINLLANYPEIIFKGKEEEMLKVQHQRKDKHHLFTITRNGSMRITHTWGADTKTLEWDRNEQSVEAIVASVLGVAAETVWTTPHYWLTRMKPLWTGKRRWVQTRAQYKKLMKKQRQHAAEGEMKCILKAWEKSDIKVAKALANLAWPRVFKMTGVTAYQTQNIIKLKYNRLRLWTGDELRYSCLASQCSGVTPTGTAHLVWQCPEARMLWENMLSLWGRTIDCRLGEEEKTKVINDVFSFKIQQTPVWLVQWGQKEQLEDWECLHEVADALWGLACGSTITAIWRRNVERLHPGGRRVPSMEDVVAGHTRMLQEAIARYRTTLMPVTQFSWPRLKVVAFVASKWRSGQIHTQVTADREVTRVGFFDGGSRGNPGPGGSGSVVIEKQRGRVDVIWAAATALGKSTMTNNVAEFVGLHRLLAQAVGKNWRGIHVVGDSALIINMMAHRRPPKAKKLAHWYRLATQLADICQVQSWTHHYRQFNKMADWLANTAMDTGKGSMQTGEVGGDGLKLLQGSRDRMDGDMRRWEEDR